jgi:hypothetical protein
LLTPCSSVEDAGDGGEQDVAPIEVRGAFIEMREAEEDCGEDERGGSSDAAL